MGSAGSALNSLENEVARRELSKPLDASDIKDGKEAMEEVIRLRKEVRTNVCSLRVWEGRTHYLLRTIYY